MERANKVGHSKIVDSASTRHFGGCTEIGVLAKLVYVWPHGLVGAKTVLDKITGLS